MPVITYQAPLNLPARPVVLEPPPEVLDAFAKEEARIGTFSPEARKRTLDLWTLDYLLRDLPGVYLAYRSVPTGVELLGLGFEEVMNVRHTLGYGPGCDITYGQI